MGLAVLLCAVVLIIPSLATVSSAQWTPVPGYKDANNGYYNWSLSLQPDRSNEPSNWAGDLTALNFVYSYQITMNLTSLDNGTTVGFKGDKTWNWKLQDVWNMQFNNYGEGDPVKIDSWQYINLHSFEELGYNISTIGTTLNLEFNVLWLKQHNITEITLRFNDSIQKWDGQHYYAAPLVSSLQVYPNKILPYSEEADWEALPTQMPLIDILSIVLPIIPFVLVGIVVVYIEASSRMKLKKQLNKKPKDLEVAPNGIAETLLKLMDRAERWMDTRRVYVLVSTAALLIVYFFLNLILVSTVMLYWQGLTKAVMFIVMMVVPYVVMAVYLYYYNKLRSDDLDWKLRIRTLKKREGDYLAELK